MMLFTDVIAQVITFLVMAGGFILLLDLAKENPSSARRAGLHQHEVFFLATGGFAGLLFNIPIIVINDSLLALNIGGVILPVFISIYLLSRRFGYGCLVFAFATICAFTLIFTYDIAYPVSLGNSYPFFSLAFIVISIPMTFLVLSLRYEKRTGASISLFITIFVITAYSVFYTSSFDPSLGVVSEFPYFLIPLFVPPAMALAFFSRDLGVAAAIAYPGASFGVLVGADVVRIPMLVTQHNIIGAIGGAGGLDLIYLSGMISISIIILYSHISGGWKSVGLSKYRYHDQMSKQKMRDAIHAARSEKYDMAIAHAITSVEERVRAYMTRFNLGEDITRCVYAMNISDSMKYDYWLMYAALRNKTDKQGAVRAIITASVLNRAILREEHARQKLASLQDRLGALIIDTIIILGILIPLGVYVLSRYEYSVLTLLKDIDTPIPTAYLLLATSLFIAYHLFFETIWAQTPGKWVAGIKVVRDDGNRISMIESLARNVIRAVDFLPLGYIIGGISLYYSSSRQRLGDIIARTVVVKVRE